MVGINWDDLEFENIGSWPIVIRIFMMIIVCAAMIAVGYNFIMQEKLSQLYALQEKILEKKKYFVEIQQEIGSLEEYKKQVILVNEQLDKLMEQLPARNEEALILEDLSQHAASLGLQFVSIKPGIPEDKEFYVANPIEIELAGNYNAFGEFISKVANMKRMVTFHHFLIKKNTKKGAEDLLMKVLAKTYWLTHAHLENELE